MMWTKKASAKTITHLLIFSGVSLIVWKALKAAGESDGPSVFLALPALILAGIYLGLLFVFYVLPGITSMFATSLLGSNAPVDKDPMHDARVAFAQGEFTEAIRIFREIGEERVGDRLPWLEIVKIQSLNLENPRLAIDTLDKVIEEKEWEDEDQFVLMLRKVEIFLDRMEDEDAAKQVLRDITNIFPESKYSASAIHRLNQLEEE